MQKRFQRVKCTTSARGTSDRQGIYAKEKSSQHFQPGNSKPKSPSPENHVHQPTTPCPSKSKPPVQLRSLPIPRILRPLPNRMRAGLHPIRDRLQPIPDLRRSRRRIDRLAETTAYGAHRAADGLCYAAGEVADLEFMECKQGVKLFQGADGRSGREGKD